MAITVNFYTFSKKDNSTAQPSGSAGLSASCVMKQGTSITRPVLVLNSAGSPAVYNYAYISDFSRYYFVSDWTVEANGLWSCTLDVDVLASWKTYIGATETYVLRSASQKDGSIADDLYPTKLSESIQIAKLVTSPFAQTFNNGCYVIGVMGTSTNGIGGVNYYHLSPAEFRSLVTYLMSDPTNYLSGGSDITVNSDDPSLIPDFLIRMNQRYYQSHLNPLQYIVSAMWFPNIPGSSMILELEDIKIGWWTLTGIQGTPLDPVADGTYTSGDIQFAKYTHPQASARGSYLNEAPYSRFHLYFGPFGNFDLDSTRMANVASILHCYYHIDFITGMGLLTVNGSADENSPIAEIRGQVGVNVNMSQISSSDFRTAAISGAQLLDKGNMAAANAIRKAITGTPVSESIANQYANTIRGVSDFAASPQIMGSTGTMIDYLINPRLVQRFLSVVDENNDHRGSPLCQEKQISTLSGYVQCMDGEVAFPGTDGEITRVRSFLEGGFFYE